MKHARERHHHHTERSLHTRAPAPGRQYTPDEEEKLLDEASADPLRSRQSDMSELRRAVREDQPAAGGESEEELLQEASANPVDAQRRRELEEMRREVGQEQPSGAGTEEEGEAALLRGASSDPVGSAERQADLEGLRK
ncbi:hypothetical protein COHA_004276 [Chlorella ohadii]|uniref:Uncharacterized protein n=1 Tax=Chlorella ohadii TaxID=2649997 RepID=A0AAD5DS15_9CHLO|nr:hypothetical protein COHA_004276 [Chlorella ohadii]